MRRALEIMLLLGGALGLGLGLDAVLREGLAGWPPLALAGTGTAALLLGVALSLGRGAKPAATLPQSGLVGAAILSFEGNRPVVLSRDAGLDVSADGDGLVRFRLKDGPRAGPLVCRSVGPAYFNSVRQDRREAAIKLAGPLEGPVRLELWALKERA